MRGSEHMKYLKIVTTKGKKKNYFSLVLWDTELKRSVGIYGRFSTRKKAVMKAKTWSKRLKVEVR